MRALAKSLLLAPGRRPFRIRLGLFRGLRLAIDPACETTLLLGLYEVETAPLLRRSARHMRSMIDVGAGYGEMTAWALRHAMVEKVLAYDPKPERWPVFQTNMELNGVSNDSRLVAVADYFPGEPGSEDLLLSLPEPVLMKLDVDGAEFAVLHQIRRVLQQRRFQVLVETHSLELDGDCRCFLAELGYHVRTVPQAWWRRWIPERRPIGFNQWLWAER